MGLGFWSTHHDPSKKCGKSRCCHGSLMNPKSGGIPPPPPLHPGSLHIPPPTAGWGCMLTCQRLLSSACMIQKPEVGTSKYTSTKSLIYISCTLLTNCTHPIMPVYNILIVCSLLIIFLSIVASGN